MKPEVTVSGIVLGVPATATIRCSASNDPEGSEIVGRATARVKVVVVFSLPEVAFTVTRFVPLSVGIPESTPLLERVRPFRSPETRLYELVLGVATKVKGVIGTPAVAVI